LVEHEKSGKIIAAICAGKHLKIIYIIFDTFICIMYNKLLITITITAPFVLFKHGIAKGKSLTSYPTVKSAIEGFYQYKEDSTVVDGKVKIFFTALQVV